MAGTTETISVVNSRRTVEEHMEFVRRNGASGKQVRHPEQTDHRARVRMFFMYPIRYCPNPTFSGDYTKAATMLDVSPDGVGFWCYEALMKGMVIHVRLPLLNEKTEWVKGKVVHCRPDAGQHQVGVSFIFDEEQS